MSSLPGTVTSRRYDLEGLWQASASKSRSTVPSTVKNTLHGWRCFASGSSVELMLGVPDGYWSPKARPIASPLGTSSSPESAWILVGSQNRWLEKLILWTESRLLRPSWSPFVQSVQGFELCAYFSTTPWWPSILHLDTIWRWAVSFEPRPLDARQSKTYSFYARLGGSRSRFECGDAEKDNCSWKE